MDIYLTPEGGARMTFPMLPEKISVSTNAKFISYSIISLGDVKIPRGRESCEISWSGTLPGSARWSAPYIRNKIKPEVMISRLEMYRDNGTKCTLLIAGTPVNKPVYIQSFKGNYVGGSGDFEYEIKFIEARELKVYTVAELSGSATSTTTKAKTTLKTRKKKSKKKSKKKNSSKSGNRTYTVKSGDCLWRIAQKFLGNGARYGEIYNANKSKIDAHGGGPNMIWPGDVLTIPGR